MSDSNQYLPVFVATGVAVLGCAAAFYFSDSDTSTKRKKQHPIHTKNFDDDLDSYDGDFPSTIKQYKRRHSKISGGAKEYDEDEDEDDEEVDEEVDDEDEDDEDDEEVDEEVDDEDEDDEGDRYLVNKKSRKSKGIKPSRK